VHLAFIICQWGVGTVWNDVCGGGGSGHAGTWTLCACVGTATLRGVLTDLKTAFLWVSSPLARCLVHSTANTVACSVIPVCKMLPLATCLCHFRDWWWWQQWLHCSDGRGGASFLMSMAVNRFDFRVMVCNITDRKITRSQELFNIHIATC
jgi:hypothetical protein